MQMGRSVNINLKSKYSGILRHPLSKGKAYEGKNRHFGAKGSHTPADDAGSQSVSAVQD